jgi:hypothetical protein
MKSEICKELSIKIPKSPRELSGRDEGFVEMKSFMVEGLLEQRAILAVVCGSFLRRGFLWRRKRGCDQGGAPGWGRGR